MTDLFDLTGKTAIVTGASAGLGEGMAEALARELDPAATIHDLRRTAEGAVSFDVVVPYDVALTDGEVRAALSKRLEELEPGAGLVIGVDRSHVL